VLWRALRPEFRVERFVPPPGHFLAAKPCQVPPCPRWNAYRGLCQQHDRAWRQAGSPDRAAWIGDVGNWPVAWDAAVSPCAVPGCPYAAGWAPLCDLHHRQWNSVAGRLGRPDLTVAEFLPHARLERRPHGGACAYPGCTFPISDDGLCDGHRHRWTRVGRPPLAELPAVLDAHIVPGFSLAGLPPLAKLEFQYLLQVRTDQRRSRILPNVWRAAVRTVIEARVDSVRDCAPAHWRRRAPRMPTLPGLFTTLLEALDDLDGPEDDYERDIWRPERLGFDIEERRGVAPLNFTEITQPWLRERVKHYAKLRLGRWRCAPWRTI
jgi:hypothetical protein